MIPNHFPTYPTDITQHVIDATPTYAELVDAMRRGKIKTKANDWTPLTRQQLELLGTPYYDLGGMFADGHDEQVTHDVWDDYVAEVNEPEWGADLVDADSFAVGFLWKLESGRTVRIIIPAVIGAMLAVNQKMTSRIQMYARINDEWVFTETNNELEQVIGIACLMVRDAELNVEFVERPESQRDSVNRGRAMANLAPISTTRVISVNNLRKQYLGGQRGPYQGGTHARPREHVRVITNREIVCKDGRRYRRKAQVVTVNPGLTRTTKVVL